MQWIAGFAVWLVVSFVLWRRMRMDYGEEKVLIFSALLGAGAVLGEILGNRILSSGWIGVLVFVITVAVGVSRKNKWEVWEWADVLGPIALAAGGSMMLVVVWDRPGEGLGLLAGALISGWLRKGYRKIRWYKSGKDGFVGLFSLLWWSVTEIAVAIISPLGIYWGGLTPEQWVGVWVLAACLVIVYLRGGRKVTEDLKDIWQKIWTKNNRLNILRK